MVCAIAAARNRAIAAARNRIIAAAKVHRRGMCTGDTPKPPVTLERLGSMLLSLKQDVKEGLKSVNSRLDSVEQKLGHSLEYQVRLEVAREYGRAYAEQDTVDCIINLVAHIPRQVLPEDPDSPGPDVHSRVTFMARKISEHLIHGDMPRKFIHALVDHLRLDESTVFLPDGSVNLVPIRRHKLVAGNWTAFTQLEDFFKLKRKMEQIGFLATSKGPGLLLMIFMACPHAMFHLTEVVTLHTILEFGFRGQINMFLNDTEVTGTIDIGESKSTLDMSCAIHHLSLHLDVLELLIEMLVEVRHRILKNKEKAEGKTNKGKVEAQVTGKATKMSREKAKAQVTKIGRLFVPKAIVSVEQCKVKDWAKELALQRGFSFHLHRL